MKLSTLIIGGFLTVALVPFLFIGYIFFTTQMATQTSLALHSESTQTSLMKNSIDEFLQNTESDVLFLSKLHELNELINSDNESDYERLKLDVQQNFLAFSVEKKIYYQIRYIDESGKEIVRVDSDGTTPAIIPEGQLQNKKGRYYFEDAMSARKGIVYVSPLDPNIERGELENRGSAEEPIYVPVIRYGTPVFNNLNEAKGIVITNVYADNFLEPIREMAREGDIMILVNKEGFYLSHPNKGKEWGFMLNNNETLQNDYDEEILQEILQHAKEAAQESEFDSHLIAPEITISEYEDSFLIHAHIWPSGNQSLSSTGSNAAYARSIGKIQGEDYYWSLITITEKDYLFAPLIKLRNEALLLGILIAIIIATVSFFIAQSITRPLTQLKDAAVRIGEGNLDTEIKIKSKNEIGELAQAFNKMTGDLSNEMNERTKAEYNLKERIKELGCIYGTSKIMEGNTSMDKALNELVKIIPPAYQFPEFACAGITYNGKKYRTKNFKETPWGQSAEIILSGREVGTIEVFYLEKKSFLREEDKMLKEVASQVGNITERKKGEEKIKMQVKELRAADKAKDSFFNIVAHELLTPMIPIHGYSELLAKGKLGKLAPKQKESLQSIRRSTKRLNNLIHEVLDFSRVNVGKLKLNIQNIHIDKVIEDSVKDLKPMAKERKLELRAEKIGKLPQVTADSSRISQVITNLIKNAIKFTPAGGKITLLAKKKEKEVIIAVKDNGIGISKKDIDKLFVRFYQVDTSLKRSTEGLGLGLAISKGIIDAHKGKIWVESTPGKGSTFYFSLPILNEGEK